MGTISAIYREDDANDVMVMVMVMVVMDDGINVVCVLQWCIDVAKGAA